MSFKNKLRTKRSKCVNENKQKDNQNKSQNTHVKDQNKKIIDIKISIKTHMTPQINKILLVMIMLQREKRAKKEKPNRGLKHTKCKYKIFKANLPKGKDKICYLSSKYKYKNFCFSSCHAKKCRSNKKIFYNKRMIVYKTKSSQN